VLGRRVVRKVAAGVVGGAEREESASNDDSIKPSQSVLREVVDFM
jgi:hypothetical protein